MNKKQQVLDTIRNLCDLKRLEFGCEVIMKHNVSGDYDVICGNYHGENPAFYLALRGNKEYFAEDIIEIIGLPVELNHLLLAIGLSKCIKPELELFSTQLDFSKRGTNGTENALYDLNLSVEKNLDKPELLDLIYELICKK